jgi:hypothetical protein
MGFSPTENQLATPRGRAADVARVTKALARDCRFYPTHHSQQIHL